MRHWIGSALVQIMACRLSGAKPLSEPMLTYCRLEPKEHISIEFYLKFEKFHSWNPFEHVVREIRPFYPGGRWVNNISAISYRATTDNISLWDWDRYILFTYNSLGYMYGVLQAFRIRYVRNGYYLKFTQLFFFNDIHLVFPDIGYV